MPKPWYTKYQHPEVREEPSHTVHQKSMELSSPVNEKWKLCIYGFFIGCLLLIILISHNQQGVNISTTRSTAFSSFAREFVVRNATASRPTPPTTTTAHDDKNQSSSSGVVVVDAEKTTELVKESSNSISVNAKELQVVNKHQPSNSIPSVDAQNPVPEIKESSNSISVDGEKLEEIKGSSKSIFASDAEFLPEIKPSSIPIMGDVDHLNPLEGMNFQNLYFAGDQATESPKNVAKECNLFEGRWVYWKDERPHYNLNVCPFLEEKMSCQNNGRPDHDYEKWVWENPHCDIPRFNGIYMLEMMRGKRVIVVGDSLNRNQWESLACLIYSSIPSSRVVVDAKAPAYMVLKAKDYDFTTEFYWSPFLVELDLNHPSGRKVLVLDKLSPSSGQWRGADVMVFNSGHWWIHLGKLKAWDFLQYKGELMEEMQIELAYDKALQTWAKWVEENVDTTKTRVFFRSISPEHKAKHWCLYSTQPIMDESYEKIYPATMTKVIEKQIRRLGSKVTYLNITKLSEYRRDAHPSVFRNNEWRNMVQKHKSQLSSFADCSHWCLPGLPDTWNRLLYASLFFDPSKVST